MPRANRTPRRYYRVEPPLSQSSLKGRAHTTQPPLQSTTDHHRPMTSFTLPSDHWAPVRITCPSLFSLNRLRLSVHLRRSPSIQLHLQHDSMVDDQSTLAPRQLQTLMCTVLNQPRAIVLSKSRKPSDLHHVFPRPRSRPPSASRSYVVVTKITTVFYF